MAEPLSSFAAVGAVSSVLQILDFTADVAKNTYKLINSSRDALRENIEVERLAREYQQLNESVFGAASTQWGPPTADQAALEKLSSMCKQEANALLGLLDDLKLQEQTQGDRVQEVIPPRDQWTIGDESGAIATIRSRG